MQKAIVVFVAFLTVGLFGASGQAPTVKQATFLSALKEGPQASLKQYASRNVHHLIKKDFGVIRSYLKNVAMMFD